MTIHSVGGHPDGPSTLSQIDVEGSAHDAEKVEVTLEITGKKLTRTVNVRKDGTWTARFKASQSTSLTGFACGALVAARVEASDGSSSQSEWVGCLECEADDDTANRSTTSEARASGDGAQTVGESSATPLLVVERSQGGDDDVLLQVKVADEAARTRSWPSRGDSPAEDSRDDSRTASGRERDDTEADSQSRSLQSDSQRDDERQGTRQDAASSSGDPEAAQEDEDEGTPLWLGAILGLSEVGLLLSLAAQGYPIIVAFAIAVALPISAMFVAKRSARSWAVWTLGSVAAAAVLVAAMLPFFGFVSMDTYLISAGIAAAGLLVGAGLMLFVGGDDDESDDAS